MDAYLLETPSHPMGGNSNPSSHSRWQPPIPLYVSPSPSSSSSSSSSNQTTLPPPPPPKPRYLTGGGLIRHDQTIYLLTTEDISQLSWSQCLSPPSSSPSSHRTCTPLSSSRLQTHPHYSSGPCPSSHRPVISPLGKIGELVHLSREKGYGLVRLDHPAFYGEIAEVPTIDSFPGLVDEPDMLDSVEFVTLGGEEVTGVVVGKGGGGGGGEEEEEEGSKRKWDYCAPLDGSGKGKSRASVGVVAVDTASYSVVPEDCGLWVRRSVASSRPMLLGHVVSFSEEGGCGFLMLPFSRFAEDLVETVRGGRFRVEG